MRNLFKEASFSAIFNYCLTALSAYCNIKPGQTIGRVSSFIFEGEHPMLIIIIQLVMMASAIWLICHSQRKYFDKNLKQQDEKRVRNDNIPVVSPETKEEKKDLLEGWELYGKVLVNQLNDGDIEKIAGGHFDEKKSLFAYHNYSLRKIQISPYTAIDFNKNPFHFKEEIFLPKKIKIITIAFEIIDRSSFKEISDLEIFVKKNGDYTKLNKIKEISLNYENDNPVEFYFDGLSKRFYEVDIYLIIKSFTL